MDRLPSLRQGPGRPRWPIQAGAGRSYDDPGHGVDRRDKLVAWSSGTGLLSSDFHGQGYATEIGRAGLRFARAALHADSVISFTERHNVASRRVMERLDMVHMGEITARGLVDGQIGEADDAPFAVYLKQVAGLRDP